MDIWDGTASEIMARLDQRGLVPKEAREPLLEQLRIELRRSFAINMRNVVEVMRSFEPGTSIHDAEVRSYIEMCRMYDSRYGIPQWAFVAECLEAMAEHFQPLADATAPAQTEAQP